MIKNWQDFDEWRISSLEYHKHISEDSYSNSLTFFEKARAYFNKHGFPKPNYYKNGKVKPFTQKESIEQKKQIHNWIRTNF